MCLFSLLFTQGATFVAGEQVFENYGQPNHIYFLYHGFSIQNNSHDCVHWNLKLTKAELEAAKSFESKQLLEVIFYAFEFVL